MAPSWRRRLVALVVVALVLLGLVLPPTVLFAVNSLYFSDVTNPPYTDEQVHAIDALKEVGITTGCTATTFCPGSTVQRFQMALFLSRALGYSNPNNVILARGGGNVGI